MSGIGVLLALIIGIIWLIVVIVFQIVIPIATLIYAKKAAHR
jgi:hypothetical protein